MVAGNKHDLAVHSSGKLTTMFLATQWGDLTGFVSVESVTATHREECLGLLLDGMPFLQLVHGA